METWIIYVATAVVILILGTLIQERSNPISIILLYSPSLPRSTLARCCFFYHHSSKVENFHHKSKKVQFFVIFFDILTSFSSRSAIEAHRLMLGIIKALNASALPTHSRSSWGPPKITTFAA